MKKLLWMTILLCCAVSGRPQDAEVEEQSLTKNNHITIRAVDWVASCRDTIRFDADWKSKYPNAYAVVKVRVRVRDIGDKITIPILAYVGSRQFDSPTGRLVGSSVETTTPVMLAFKGMSADLVQRQYALELRVFSPGHQGVTNFSQWTAWR